MLLNQGVLFSAWIIFFIEAGMCPVLDLGEK